MTTKNLARTIIEGGRDGYSKWNRRSSHRTERVLTRAYLARAGQLEDGFDAYAVGVRPKAYKSFADKLGAPRRWLRSHVGRPWDKVRSEMFALFDARTLAGQHIVFDHLLRDVAAFDDASNRYPKFVVDRHGILREPPPRRGDPRWIRRQDPLAYQVDAWACNRRVGGRDDALYWFVLATQCKSCYRRDTCCCPRIDGKLDHGPHDHYRQDRRLNAEELEFWHAMLEDTRARFRHQRS